MEPATNGFPATRPGLWSPRNSDSLGGSSRRSAASKSENGSASLASATSSLLVLGHSKMAWLNSRRTVTDQEAFGTWPATTETQPTACPTILGQARKLNRRCYHWSVQPEDTSAGAHPPKNGRRRSSLALSNPKAIATSATCSEIRGWTPSWTDSAWTR